MNVKELYENALALGLSRIEEEDDLDVYAVKLFNILMAETKVYNDQIREKKGKKPQEKAAMVTELIGEVDCEPELYAALSYAFASKLLAAQEDFGLASMYSQQAAMLYASVVPAVMLEVE